jgi:hypothetical protein
MVMKRAGFIIVEEIELVQKGSSDGFGFFLRVS